MSEQYKRTARRMAEELWNSRKLNLAEELFTDDYQHHDPNSPNFGTGPEAYKKLVGMYTRVFPDFHFRIDEMIAEGDTVVLRWTVTGTHKGEWRGIAPTGKRVTLTGTTVSRFSNEKIAEQWVSWDALGLMHQLGAIQRERKPAA